MKKLLFRKLLLNYMSFFLIALISSSIVIWVFQAVNYLDIMIEDGRDYLIYINYSLLNFPKIFSKLFPFVLFFSLFYVTIKYELNNELLIFWNFGINKIEIINFILKFSIFLLFIQLILTSFIIPKSQDLARSFLRTSTVNFFGNFIKPQRFNDTIKGVTIYSQNKDNKGNLYNLYLKKEINSNDFQIIYAKKGEFKDINGVSVLVLYDGEQITTKNNQITNINFSKSDFPLQNLETNTTTYKKTQETSTIDLFKCVNEIYFLKKITSNKMENCTLNNIENIFREIYKRIIIPLYIPLLSLIPFLLFFYSKENDVYFKIRVVTFLAGLCAVIISETSIRFISKVFDYNVLFIFIPIILIFLLYIIFLFQFNLKFKKINND